MIEIKQRRTGKVLKTVDADTLQGADLRGAILYGANMRGAGLSDAHLSNAILRGADLSDADLSDAILRDADLYGANMRGADLTYAILRGASFEDAYFGYTTLANCPTLHLAKGLETIQHKAGSFLDVVTLRACVSHLPDVFLHGVGYTQWEIQDLRAMYSHGIQFYSCFLSYARANDEFAERLYSDLIANNVTCWKDTHDMKAGDYWRKQINEAIRLRDKTVLICSKDSLVRPVVIEELLEAIAVQKEAGALKLMPIRLDDFLFSEEMEQLGKEQTATGEWPQNWLAKVRAFHIPDFSRWKDHDAYMREFEKLLRNLKTPATR